MSNQYQVSVVTDKGVFTSRQSFTADEVKAVVKEQQQLPSTQSVKVIKCD
jgi:hypothetical protein